MTDPFQAAEEALGALREDLDARLVERLPAAAVDRLDVERRRRRGGRASLVSSGAFMAVSACRRLAAAERMDVDRQLLDAPSSSSRPVQAGMTPVRGLVIWATMVVAVAAVEPDRVGQSAARRARGCRSPSRRGRRRSSRRRSARPAAASAASCAWPDSDSDVLGHRVDLRRRQDAVGAEGRHLPRSRVSASAAKRMPCGDRRVDRVERRRPTASRRR